MAHSRRVGNRVCAQCQTRLLVWPWARRGRCNAKPESMSLCVLPDLASLAAVAELYPIALPSTFGLLRLMMWRNARGIGMMPLPCESDLPDLPDMSDMPDLPDLDAWGNLPKGDNGSPAEFPEPCSPVPCLAAGTQPGALPHPAPSSASSDCPELPNLSDMP